MGRAILKTVCCDVNSRVEFNRRGQCYIPSKCHWRCWLRIKVTEILRSVAGVCYRSHVKCFFSSLSQLTEKIETGKLDR